MSQVTANCIFFWNHQTNSTLSLPALLHFVRCDWLRPKAIAGLATTTRPSGEVASGTPPVPFWAWLQSQVQRGWGSIWTASINTNKAERKGEIRWSEYSHRRHNVMDKVWITHKQWPYTLSGWAPVPVCCRRALLNWPTDTRVWSCGLSGCPSPTSITESCEPCLEGHECSGKSKGGIIPHIIKKGL